MEWEYKVVKFETISNLKEPSKLQEELNNYGKEGWELVSIFYPPNIGEGWMPQLYSYSLVFKRQASNM